MPHLISTGIRAAAQATAARIGIGAPGWVRPLPALGGWQEPGGGAAPLHWAVLNTGRGGPGEGPDPYRAQEVERLRGTGTPVLGHLDLQQGFRPFAELVSDARRLLDWYRVDGFYLARCPADPAHLHETRRTTRTLRALGDGGLLVLGHGTHPYPGYAKLADQLVTFEGGWPDYRWSQVAEWTADHPPERFCHLVHGVPGTHLEEALRIARWQGAGTVYFTDRSTAGGANPWETLPGYWDDIVSRLGTGVSE